MRAQTSISEPSACSPCPPPSLPPSLLPSHSSHFLSFLLQASLLETASVQMKYAFLGTAGRPVTAQQGQVLPSWPGAFSQSTQVLLALPPPSPLHSRSPPTPSLLVAIRVPGTAVRSTALYLALEIFLCPSGAPVPSRWATLAPPLAVGHQRSSREMVSTFESATRSGYRGLPSW